jgi:hypothetical protein
MGYGGPVNQMQGQQMNQFMRGGLQPQQPPQMGQAPMQPPMGGGGGFGPPPGAGQGFMPRQPMPVQGQPAPPFMPGAKLPPTNVPTNPQNPYGWLAGR